MIGRMKHKVDWNLLILAAWMVTIVYLAAS